ncbi:uncharacterized protein Z519_09276 [Cladophialophora bantiana CBS 173.52]|uniref:Uncharacterized protein n=1 Tax=Cladophialophora bantiana (strain ATCC 10958 / CBS 173.52 / CDC B-1940 / NIH 8579) TaxID=1442370 RepID=A0A0D2FTH0_CLAB1|nr:uncharacterized protein Z519_09276 [Cladophialophora bantiana CBS 173.52]KIW89847.1 hypothetical protein Z519_09276 [Cladophialophora bantiana CBS 173.52]
MSEKRYGNVIVNEIKDSQRLRYIHWRAPTVMGAGFLGGVVLMTSHHAFYQSLSRQPADNALLQLWAIRAGTALAFLSKLCLAIGTGVAYDQWMWVNLHSKPHEMGSLDSMFAILGNAFEFLAVRIWWRRPVLAFLAAMTWLLPLSAIITPGTLSVQPVLVSQNGTLIVPQRPFTTDSNAFCGVISDGNTTTYASMATGLSNPTFATVLSNSVLPLRSSSTNLTFNLQFFGPAVTCNMSSSEEFSWAKKAMLEYENMTDTRVFYYGWAPQSGWGPDVNGSFFASTDVQIGNNRLDFVSKDAARVFIYLNTTGVDETGNRIPGFDGEAEAQMITCALYNASYDAHFAVKSTGAQFITSSPQFENWMPALSTMEGTLEDLRVRQQMNMQAVMESFVMMVNGPITYSNDISFPTINSVYGLAMNKALFPAQPALNQTALALRQAKQNEMLFQNITLSMRYSVVSGSVGDDQTIAAAVRQRFESQFVYEPRTLLIAYGLSTFFALICVLLGVHALLHNGASYTNSFSTIVRVTRDPALSRLIADEGDLQGAEPVPKHIRKAELRLGRSAKSLSLSYASSWI